MECRDDDLHEGLLHVEEQVEGPYLERDDCGSEGPLHQDNEG